MARTLKQRQDARKRAAWERDHRDYRPRTPRQHARRGLEILQGGALDDVDRLQLALGSEPVELVAPLYDVTRSYVRSLRKRPYHTNQSRKAWTARENRLGPGLDPRNSALRLIKGGSK